MADKLPGKGLMGWLGRQVGHVGKAVSADPVKGKLKKKLPPAKKVVGKRAAPKTSPQAAPRTKPAPEPPRRAKPAAAAPSDIVLYKRDTVAELPHPTNPNLKLRRTVIDEVIVDRTDEERQR